MPAVQEISETLIRQNITRAIGEVFKTMLGREAHLTSESQGRIEQTSHHHAVVAEAAGPQVVGTVGFIGEINGLIYLYFDHGFARLCTCHLLGFTEAELDEAGDEVINDAIGELTNMSVGSFKNALCDAGFGCKLTIPSIIRGSNFSVEPVTTAQRFVYRFECSGHRVVTDILVKAGD